MALDKDKIDDTALALLYLIASRIRACREDWDVLAAAQPGMIAALIQSRKRGQHTDEGLLRAKALVTEMFAKLDGKDIAQRPQTSPKLMGNDETHRGHRGTARCAPRPAVPNPDVNRICPSAGWPNIRTGPAPQRTTTGEWRPSLRRTAHIGKILQSDRRPVGAVLALRGAGIFLIGRDAIPVVFNRVGRRKSIRPPAGTRSSFAERHCPPRLHLVRRSGTTTRAANSIEPAAVLADIRAPQYRPRNPAAPRPRQAPRRPPAPSPFAQRASGGVDTPPCGG